MYSKRNQNTYDVLIKKFKKEIKEILIEDKKSKYLILIEKSPNLVSRVRTYKGIIDKNIISIEDYIQFEKRLDKNQSRITTLIKFKDSYFNYLVNLMFDDTNCFLISSYENYFESIFIDEFMRLFNVNGWTHINYLSCMFKYCVKGDYIYRIGGNDGEEFWSLQIFKLKLPSNSA